MRDHRPGRRQVVVRAALLLLSLTGGAALTASTAVAAWRLLPDSLGPGAAPAQLLVGAAAALATLASGWLTLAMLLAAAARLPGSIGRRCSGLRDRYAPAVVQRWAAVVLGASVTAVVLPGTAATAAQVAGPSPGWSPSTPDAAEPGDGSAERDVLPEEPAAGDGEVPEPGWVPSRPAPGPRADADLLTGRTRRGGDRAVVVLRGDSLWGIAAARLGAGASTAEIARSWPRWYAANRQVIGEDPDDLRPGTRLQPPGPEPGTP